MQEFNKKILSKKNPNIINEDNHSGMLETLNLVAVPGMREKLLEGMNEPLSECIPETMIQW